MTRLQAWLLAARPKTLPAVIAPVLAGQWLAWNAAADNFSFLLAAMVLLCALLLQVAVNLANDVFDFHHGVDQAGRLGPARAAQSGWLTSQQLIAGLRLILLLAAATGLYLVWQGGWWYLLLGGLSLLAALAYSAGPFPLASNALGEVTVFLFFGLLAVAGGYALHQLTPDWQVWLTAAAFGCLTAAIMLVNNIRDRRSDAQAGKHTLVILLGVGASRVLYVVLLALPGIWLCDQSGFGGLVVLLVALLLARGIFYRDGAALNRQLAQSALFCLLYAAVFVAGQWHTR